MDMNEVSALLDANRAELQQMVDDTEAEDWELEDWLCECRDCDTFEAAEVVRRFRAGL